MKAKQRCVSVTPYCGPHCLMKSIQNYIVNKHVINIAETKCAKNIAFLGLVILEPSIMHEDRIQSIA